MFRERLRGRLTEAVLASSIGKRNLALCLHRVAQMHRSAESLPMCVSVESELDSLLETLSSVNRKGGWLTLSFDDGYKDSADYIRSRAPKYPHVSFLLFVCPEKIEKRVGFRWDAWETLRTAGKATGTLDDYLEHDRNLERENERADLVESAKNPLFQLATLDECRELQTIPNVSLGNHTNTHFKLAEIPAEDAAREIERSHETFTRLFGKADHFAFPYGTPGESYRPEHVNAVRRLGYTHIWSTVGRPFDRTLTAHGELPRFAVHGDWPLADTIAWIAKASLKSRVISS